VPRLPEVTPRQLVRAVRKLGFALDRQRGSHAIYLRESDDSRIAIPVHARSLKKETLHGIVSDLGFTVEECLDLL
jgi:predicted RNA binding protein YcfA (HicA-like mRNA interferase family)